MHCPACSHTLTSLELSGVTVDVCEGGCGGIWFDKHELSAFDEPAERADPLLAVHRDEHVVTDETKHRCPRCERLVMQRHFFSTRFEVEVDECPGCGGLWLDHGELVRIRGQFDTAEDRQAANAAFLATNLAPMLAEIDSRFSTTHERASLLSRLFAWACPGASLDGKRV